MKKLISILLMLMMLVCGVAMAEETDPATTEAPAVVATEDTTDVEATEEKIDWTQVSMLNKGLIVTAGGLAGTFLVLILFFLTIKLMQKVLK